MKGFRKMDEMEMYIAYKSMFWAYAYMVAFLVVWVAIGLYNKVSVSVPLLLFVTQIVLQKIIRLTLEKQMDGKHE